MGEALKSLCLSVYKSRGLMYPFTCARVVLATPAATLGEAEEAKTQDNQSSAKPEARGAKGQGGLSPARALPGQLAQHQQSCHP